MTKSMVLRTASQQQQLYDHKWENLVRTPNTRTKHRKKQRKVGNDLQENRISFRAQNSIMDLVQSRDAEQHYGIACRFAADARCAYEIYCCYDCMDDGAHTLMTRQQYFDRIWCVIRKRGCVPFTHPCIFIKYQALAFYFFAHTEVRVKSIVIDSKNMKMSQGSAFNYVVVSMMYVDKVTAIVTDNVNVCKDFLTP